MVMNTTLTFLDNSAIQIEAHQQAIKQADNELAEIGKKKDAASDRIAGILKKLQEAGMQDEARMQHLASVKQQYELLKAKYDQAKSYTLVMRHTEGEHVAVGNLLQLEKEFLEVEKTYLRIKADCDQFDAKCTQEREALEGELSILQQQLGALEARKIAISQGKEQAYRELGNLLYEASKARIKRFQNDLKSKRSQEQEAEKALSSILPEEFDRLKDYPELQKQARHLLPFEDECTRVIEQAVLLLKMLLEDGYKLDIPLDLLHRQNCYSLSDLLAWNTGLLEQCLSKFVSRENKEISAYIENLERLLEAYREEKEKHV